MQAVEFFHLNTVELAESFCWAIGNLAFPNTSNQICLSQLGACKTTLDVLNKYIESEQCIIECLRAIRNVAHYCNEALIEYYDIGIAESIIHVLTHYSQSTEVVQWGWYSIGSLAENKLICIALGKLNACKLVGDMLGMFKSEEDIVQWIALAVSELSKDLILNRILCNEGLVTLLVESMVLLGNNCDVIEECCIAITSLLKTELNFEINETTEDFKDAAKFYVKQEVITSTNICDELMKFWVTYEKNENIIQESSLVLSVFIQRLPNNTNEISDYEVLNEKLENLISEIICPKLIATNIIKLIPKILQRYSKNSMIVNAILSITSAILMTADSKIKINFINSSFISILSTVLAIHLENINICLEGLKILSYLTIEHSSLNRIAGIQTTNNSMDVFLISSLNLTENESNLVQTSTVIVNILSRHGQVIDFKVNESPNNNELNSAFELTLQCLLLISDLCSKNSLLQLQLGSAGAGQVVLDTINSHKRNSQLVIIGCATLTALTKNISIEKSKDQSIANHDYLYDSNVCELLISLLNDYHDNLEVLFFVCVAIDSVCEHDRIRTKLCELGCCKLLLVTIDRYQNGEGFVTAGMSALGSLFEYGPSRLIAQKQLNSGEDFDCLQKIASLYLDHPAICQCFCRLVAYIGSKNQSNCNFMFENGILEVIFKILSQYYEDSPNTVKFALLAIAEMSKDNTIVIEYLHHHHICKIVVATMEKYLTRDFIAEVCCRVICSGLSIYSIEFGELGGCELVLAALSMHQDKEPVLVWVCRAIGILAEVKSNVTIMCNNNAPEHIVKTLQQHLQYESSLYALSKRMILGKGNNSLITSNNYVFDEHKLGLINTTIIHTVNGNNSTTNNKYQTNSKSITNVFANLSAGFSKMKAGFTMNTSSNNNSMNSQQNSIQNSSNEGSVLWGILALYFLLRGSDCNPTYQSILNECGICDVIYKLLLKYAEIEPLALACCKAIVVLCSGNPTISNKFGMIGVCGLVVEVMQIHPSSMKVSPPIYFAFLIYLKISHLKITKWGSHAVAILASFDDESNITKLASAGICETISVAIQAHQSRYLN